MRLLCSIIILPRWDSYADHKSPARDVIELRRHKGADVRSYDPYASAIRHNDFEMAREADLDAALQRHSGQDPGRSGLHDRTVVVTDHLWYDWTPIRRRARLMMDTRGT